MKNKYSFLLKAVGHVSDLELDKGNTFKVTDSLSVDVASSGPSKIIDTDDFLYFRFGTLFKSNIQDEEIAQLIFLKERERVSSNGGTYIAILFNKSNSTLEVYGDRLGIHTILYANVNESELLITNEMSKFGILSEKANDLAFAHEMITFRLNSGSHTHSENISKVPAGKYAKFDKNMSFVNSDFHWMTEQRISPNSNLDMSSAVKGTKELIDNHFDIADIKNKKTAILLSGGVDSSLLTALAYKHNKNLVAITPVFGQGDNPELDAAKEMAQIIGLEHRVIDITDADIKKGFSDVVDLINSGIRSPHALIFSIMVEYLSQEFEAVIFGEGADLVFGYNAIKRAGARFEKQKKLYALKPVLPLLKPLRGVGVVNKVYDLVSESIAHQIVHARSLNFDPKIRAQLPKSDAITGSFDLANDFDLLNLDASKVSKFELENIARDFIILTANVDHFYTMGSAANKFGVEVISPFLDIELTKFVSTFGDNLYFGEEFSKPVLRKLATEFYPERLMYSRKRGFPVPYVDWMNSSLKDKADKARAFISEHFGDDVKNDSEFLWLVLSLQEMNAEELLLKIKK